MDTPKRKPGGRFLVNRLLIVLAVAAILIGLGSGQWNTTLLHARLL
ncbi:MAG: hypothetical protein MUQ10_19840 [Anaerolineae bacterium]|nr:hypothetical protein [Anaerolineae bacterium]